MSDSLPQLLTRMRGCTLCVGLPLGPKPIFKLTPAAKILIVGQAPGRFAHERGRPFDDPSGVRLRAWLGVDEQTFYGDERIGIFPMGLCFPGTGANGDLPPRAECAPAWRAQVLDKLQSVQLTIVLGRYAINWHLPALKNKSVTEAVAETAKSTQSTFVFPHPSPRNNRWLGRNEWFERDVVPHVRARVAQLLDGNAAPR